MKRDVYRTKSKILTTSIRDTCDRIKAHIAHTPLCACKFLRGRKVRLERYLEATVPRKDATKRLRTFFVALDIIRHSRIGTARVHKQCREYELQGCDACGVLVRVHLREERACGDRQLFLISSFSVASKNENPLP